MLELYGVGLIIWMCVVYCLWMSLTFYKFLSTEIRGESGRSRCLNTLCRSR